MLVIRHTIAQNDIDTIVTRLATKLIIIIFYGFHYENHSVLSVLLIASNDNGR